MSVANNGKTTGKTVGGVTGKGFLPGQSGNPSGRPKKPLTDRYRGVLEADLPEDLRKSLKLAKGSTFGDAIAMSLARAAIKGDRGALGELMNRVEGKLEDEDKGGGMLVVNASVMRNG